MYSGFFLELKRASEYYKAFWDNYNGVSLIVTHHDMWSLSLFFELWSSLKLIICKIFLSLYEAFYFTHDFINVTIWVLPIFSSLLEIKIRHLWLEVFIYTTSLSQLLDPFTWEKILGQHDGDVIFLSFCIYLRVKL